ncbi:TRAP transporter small permease [Planktomarina sp.]|uniref:TRAP transporter small permease subunit n=1 Tax=Planktomarina sp. TaxID=2024851 RepID=UPI00288FD587|nr:TRAP transporter small permease [Planktomarina sp.]
MGLSIFTFLPFLGSVFMRASPHSIIQWILPLAFIACAAWIVWSGATYIMAFGGYTDALAARYRQIMILDYAILFALPLIALAGIWSVHVAPMEIDDTGPLDGVAMFVGRVTMMLIALLVAVMMYEVISRYVFERPTLWANELSLWLAGFIFILAGLYAMQQRSHIRIYLLYDMMPRGFQKACDIISTALIVVFAFFLVYGGYGEAKAKLLRWETFGTVFDPPIPATIKPLVLAVVTMVAIQAILNLIKDWNLEPVIHTAADDIDQDEIERLKKSVGDV